MCRCLDWVVPVSNDPCLRVRERDLCCRNQDQEGHAVLATEAIGVGGGHEAVPADGVRYRKRDS
ncbi:hypothetical protein ALQ32_200143 [Pseudomonas syringae pv. tagetis]|uniref:Uncharacterized protein n=1 Tax=Pseudomonas syringae pv. tagetis TaxID=129140 RepID=A0A3M3ZGA8_9PSED|nr:hypothetical protein ALQ32_200143 [Pseudomonas syringae pv. tagetis]